ncbi:MAG: hypothetical protein RIR65_370 [Planctomycetota bacterium]
MSRARIAAGFGALEAVLARAEGREALRESAGGWSVQEIAEHVATANIHLLRLARTCAGKCRARAARGLDAARPPTASMEDLLAHASSGVRWEAPGHMRPAGSVALGASSATIAAQRDEALALWDELCADDARVGRMHDVGMVVLGPGARIALPELLVFVALHAERHARQAERALRAN